MPSLGQPVAPRVVRRRQVRYLRFPRESLPDATRRTPAPARAKQHSCFACRGPPLCPPFFRPRNDSGALWREPMNVLEEEVWISASPLVELVLRAQSGDREALGQLMVRYEGAVYAIEI